VARGAAGARQSEIDLDHAYRGQRRSRGHERDEIDVRPPRTSTATEEGNGSDAAFDPFPYLPAVHPRSRHRNVYVTATRAPRQTLTVHIDGNVNLGARDRAALEVNA
jgi:hypothetical protein